MKVCLFLPSQWVFLAEKCELGLVNWCQCRAGHTYSEDFSQTESKWACLSLPSPSSQSSGLMGTQQIEEQKLYPKMENACLQSKAHWITLQPLLSVSEMDEIGYRTQFNQLKHKAVESQWVSKNMQCTLLYG